MPKLYYCNTIYNANPISDVNPLILQRYQREKILIFCAREQQVQRIKNNTSAEDENRILVLGWWEMKDMGFITETYGLNFKEIDKWDIIVIVSKARIDPLFSSLLRVVEGYCKQ